MTGCLRFDAQLRARLIDLNDTAYMDVMLAVSGCEAALLQQIDMRDSHPIIYTTEYATLFVEWSSIHNCYIVTHFEVWDTPPPNEPATSKIASYPLDTYAISPDAIDCLSFEALSKRQVKIIDDDLDENFARGITHMLFNNRRAFIDSSRATTIEL